MVGAFVSVDVWSTACCALALSAFASRVNSNNAAAVKAVRKKSACLELMCGGGGKSYVQHVITPYFRD